MILIISEEHDVSTKHVIDWLFYYNISYVVINEFDFILNCSLYISSSEVDFIADCNNDKKFKLSEIKAFWYRRGFINKFLPKLNKETLRVLKEEHLYDEWTRLQALIHRVIEKKPGIGNFEISIYFNKVYQLILAKETGLKFPDSLISNNVDDLLNFKNNYDLVITKNIERDFNKRNDNLNIFTTGTTVVTEENINNLEGGHSLPSLVQQGIHKKYELRIFFLAGKFWAMCIFHNKSHTEIDYRSLNGQLRMVPYKLPSIIEEKLILMMARLNLNCGSIDMLVDSNNEYYFLEVNPVGQYDFLSARCNYYLDREIAVFLKQYS